MTTNRLSLRRQIIVAAAATVASVAVACTDTTAPSAPTLAAPPTLAHPIVASGGNTIGFQRDSGSLPRSIYTMNDDGTNLVKVAKMSLTSPRISPDGTKLAVQAQQRLSSEIVVIDLATKRRTVVADTPNNEQAPVWFTSITAGTTGIYRAPVDGEATPVRLTTPAANTLDSKLSWTR